MGGCERQGQQAITRWALWHQASRNNLAPGINNLALGITCRSNCLRHSPQAPRQHDTSYILEKWSVTLWSDRQLFGIVITKQLCASIPVATARTMLECMVWMVSSYLHSVCSTLHCLLSSLSHQKDERSYSRGKVWWGGHLTRYLLISHALAATSPNGQITQSTCHCCVTQICQK